MTSDATDNVVRSPTPRAPGFETRPRLDMGPVTPTPGLRPAARRTRKTSERVASDIVRDIVAMGLRTGDRLSLEAAMVEQYRVSRVSVREALRLLEVQGLIHLKPGPGGGPVVGAVEPANLARMAALYFHFGAATYGQLFETQAMLEPLCAHLAASNPLRGQLLQPFVESAEPGTEDEYRRAFAAFHSAVWTLAENPVLTLLSQAVTHIVSEHVVATMDPVELHPRIFGEHVALAKAVSAGHGEKARRLMADHFTAQHDYYKEHWPSRLLDLIEWR
jgi:GntR family transcriptional repressor for pyruvate dehydrogenase complex